MGEFNRSETARMTAETHEGPFGPKPPKRRREVAMAALHPLKGKSSSASS
jgi:hypothetical protein